MQYGQKEVDHEKYTIFYSIVDSEHAIIRL